MRSLRIVAVTLLLSTSTMAADPLDPAREMVQLMAADESMAVGSQLAFRKLHHDGKMTAHQKSVCEKSVSTSMFTNLFAEVALKQLTAEEIRAASQFFQTEA